MPNPFTLGIARGSGFCNRESELVALRRHAANGDNVLLFSPRRYGKTSLVRRVFELLDEQGFLTIYADLFPIVSERDLISRLSAALLRGIGRGLDQRTLAEKLRDVFKRLIPSIELKPEGYSLSMRFDQTAECGPLLEDLLQGLQGYVRKKGVRACVALDEFQEITELPESKRIEGILRSHIQSQEEISYFFVGSRRRTLQEMFSEKGRAFYKSAFSYSLGEVPKEDFVPHICRCFAESGKLCPAEIAEQIFEQVAGYPYYVQKLASLAWDLSATRCDAEALRSGYDALLEMEKPEFEATWSALTLVQRALLKALARESTASPYSREFLQRHQLSIGGTQRALQTLLSRDLVEKRPQSGYRLTDPLLAAWLVRE